MYKNSYFQLCTKIDGTYIIIYPSMLGGEKLEYSELNTYLLTHKLSSGCFDANALKKAVNESQSMMDFKLSDEVIPPVNEEFSIKVSGDKMQAVGRFYCASEGGKRLSKEDIIKTLAASGIIYGINDENIESYIKDRQYCTNIVLAEGTPPGVSRDAVIKYTFEQSKSRQPAVLEDGTVDFHKLNLINHVKKGDVLAVRIPPYEGAEGKDIFGTPRPARRPVDRRLVYGVGVAVSKDECQLVAQDNGHVIFEKEKVTVTGVYKIDGDVGTATGNITFDGSVEVKGDVLTDYVVEATGDIFVGGCVDGATLVSGGQIILTRGIHGGNKGVLIAEGDIAAKFIESSTVTAGGNISTEAILYSKVTANGQILVTQSRGLISGGELKSGSLISAKTVGSERLGANTLLEVGIAPNVLERLRDLEKGILEKQAERKKLQQVLVFLKKKLESGEQIPNDKVQLAKTLPRQLSTLMNEINKMLNEYSKLKTELDQAKKGKIVVENAIHPGTKIRISNVSYYVRETITHCQIIMDGTDIRFVR